MKDLLAKRAGFRCSFPDCRKLTVGPGAGVHEVSLSGVASHIYSAADHGPRGREGLRPEEIRASTNGIWLCHNHGRLVDNNRGDRYPANLLISYRALHEAWTARQHGDATANFGWIQELTVHESPVVRNGSRMRLGHVNVIDGSNDTGKSALCEWLAGSCDPVHLHRWLKNPVTTPLRISVVYYSSDAEHRVDISTALNSVEYILNSQSVPFNPVPFRSVLMNAPSWREDDESSLSYLARHIGEDIVVAKNLLELVPELGSGVFERVEVDGESGVVYAQSEGKNIFEFRVVSGGMQMRLAVDMALVKARVLARYYPTVLILDRGMGAIDRYGWEHYVEYLTSLQELQTIIVSAHWHRDFDWQGWEVTQLRGSVPDVALEQN